MNDTSELGKTFYKVDQVKNTKLANAIRHLPKQYLDFYTHPDEIEELSELGLVGIKRITIFSLIGSTPIDVVKTTIAYEDLQGNTWIDSALYHDVFW